MGRRWDGVTDRGGQAECTGTQCNQDITGAVTLAKTTNPGITLITPVIDNPTVNHAQMLLTTDSIAENVATRNLAQTPYDSSSLPCLPPATDPCCGYCNSGH